MACHRMRYYKVFHAKPVTASRGHVNCISAEEAQEDPNVVLGTLLVNCHPASVLFDTGASHSFISENYARLHNVSLTSFSTDGFVDKFRKRCALMQTEVAAKLRTKALTEPCLLLGVSRNFLGCILHVPVP